MKNQSTTLRDTAQQYVGQKVAVLCARYHWRGFLSEANDDHLVLSNVGMVESSGIAMNDAPSVEDPHGGSVVISYGAIEVIWQPRCVHAPLPGE